MKRFKMKSPPYKVGITIIAYNLFPGELDRCVRLLENTKTEMGFILQVIEEGDVDMFSKAPDGRTFFNRNKGHNFGIKTLKKDVKYIICADVDLLIPPYKIDQTIAAWKPKSVVWSVAVKSVPQEEIHLFDWKRWQTELEKRKSGKGGWNCGTWNDWVACGGWNENMFGRWMDRDLHKRFRKSGIKVIELWDNPLVHIEHPPRFTDEDSDYLKRMVKKFNSDVKFERFL